MSKEVNSAQSFQFPEVRVVEASAGSGKTYALAKRYVQLLLNPALKEEQIPIRQILAITFTNKAAFEMKSRILEFLKRLAFNQFDPKEAEEILKPIGITQEEASVTTISFKSKRSINSSTRCSPVAPLRST